MRFPSSKTAGSEITSLEEYVARSPVEQKDIFYLCAPSRELAEASPYFETFKRRGVEVLFCHEPIDEFVMTSLMNYEGRRIVSAQSADVELPEAIGKAQEEGHTEEEAEGAHSGPALEGQELDDFRAWVGNLLRDDVLAVKVSQWGTQRWRTAPPPSPSRRRGTHLPMMDNHRTDFYTF